MYKSAALLLLIWFSPLTAAERTQCIQDPQRLAACPHQLYRVAQLPAMTAPAVICICVTDFTKLLHRPVTEQEKDRANEMFQQMEAVHGEKLQMIIAILRRQ